MKTNQKQRIAIVSLLTLMTLVIGVQVLGAGGPLPKVVSPARSTQIVAQNEPQVDRVETPVIARDPFWNPRLKQEPGGTPTPKATPPSQIVAGPLPNPMPDPPSQWIPPLRPENIHIDATKESPKEQPKPEAPKVDPPKKSLRVCGFLATQTPTLILTMNGEETKTCTTGQEPWPGVKILSIKIDQATLKIGNKTVTVTMGQELTI